MVTSGLAEEANNSFLYRYQLIGNYPNPFNSKTKIRYSLSVLSDVKLILYNVLGKKVKEFELTSKDIGIHDYTLTLGDLSTGIYFCKMEVQTKSGTPKFHDTIKIMYIK